MSNQNSRLDALVENLSGHKHKCMQADAISLHKLIDYGCFTGDVICADCSMAEANMKRWIMEELPNEVEACKGNSQHGLHHG